MTRKPEQSFHIYQNRIAVITESPTKHLIFNCAETKPFQIRDYYINILAEGNAMKNLITYIVTTLILMIQVSDVLAQKKSEPKDVITNTPVVIGDELSEGNLLITIHDDADMQVARFENGLWQNQFYGNHAKSIRLHTSKGDYTGDKGYYHDFATLIPTLSNNLESGSKAVTILQQNNTLKIEQTTSRHQGDDIIIYQWEITNLSNEALHDLRFFAGGDTYLAGNDQGAGYWSEQQSMTGVIKTTNNTQRMLLFQGITTPSRYESRHYNKVRNSVLANELHNIIDTNATTDNGYALQWNQTTLQPAETWIIEAAEHFSLKPSSPLLIIAPALSIINTGETGEVLFTIKNIASTTITANLEVIPSDPTWSGILMDEPTITLQPDQTIQIAVKVTPTNNVIPNNTEEIKLLAHIAELTSSDIAHVIAIHPLDFITQPESQSACNEGPVSFEVTNTPFSTIQWQLFIESWQDLTNNEDIEGVHKNILNINNALQHQNKKFRCRITQNNEVKYSQIVTILPDTVAPHFSIQDTVTVYMGNNSCSGIHSGFSGDPYNITDNCTVASVYNNLNGLTTLNNSTFSTPYTTVNWTVEDINGNKTTCQQIVVLKDTIAPVIYTNTQKLALSEEGTTTINQHFLETVAQDNCGIANITASKLYFDCDNIGNNLIMLTVTDLSGNITQDTISVVISDNLPPVIHTKDILLSLDNHGTVSLTKDILDDVIFDNCGISSIKWNKTTFTCTDLGTQNIVVTVTDNAGNATKQNLAITVEDTEAPTITAHDTTLYLNNKGITDLKAEHIIIDQYDNCGIESIAISKTTFTCENTGINELMATATDKSGNESIATFKVEVLDTIKPTIEPINTTVYLNEQGIAMLSPYTIAGKCHDNCEILSYSLSQTIFTTDQLGTNTVQFIAADVHNNETIKNIIVEVMDTIKPVVEKIAPIAIFTKNQQQLTIPSLISKVKAEDNCGILQISQLPPAGTPIQSRESTTPITIYVNDIAGNETTSQCTLILSEGKELNIDTIQEENNTSEDFPNGSIRIITPGISGTLYYSIDDGSTWIKGDNSFEYLSGGTYNIRIKNQYGWEQIYPNNPVIIENSFESKHSVAEKAGFTLYPNPAFNQTHITLDKDVTPTKIYLKNLKNQLIRTIYWNGASTFNIDTSELQSGLYVVSIETSNKLYKNKLVVSH